MELLQLKYFVELAEHEHLTKVANMMFVSPPAISSSISRLENELGAKLFYREGRNIKLSPYGELFLTHAKKCLREIEDGKKELNDMTAVVTSNNVLTIATTNPYIWSRQIHGFRFDYPDIKLKTISYDLSNEHYSKPSQEFDLVIASPQSFHNEDWDYKLLMTDRIAVAVPPQCHLYSKETFKLEELKDEWFIELSDTSFNDFIHILCQKRGFTPQSRVSCDYTLRPRISLNEGIPFFTSFNCQPLDLFNGLKFIPVVDEDAFRTQAVFWKRGRYISAAAKLFINYMVDSYCDYKPY